MIHLDVVPDNSQIREAVQQIFVDVIGEELRSIPDNIPILDLGVGSLALVEGMRRVYDQFGVLISIRRVIEGQVTLGGLALYIEQELNSSRSRKNEPPDALRQWKIEREVPLALSQQHIGFLSRYSSEAAGAFNEALLLRLDGVLDGPAIQTAIETVSNRYESLRTALDREHDTLDIGIGEPLELIVSSVQLEKVQQKLVEIVSQPFEPGNRLFRAELFRLSDTEHILALVGHSLIIAHEALVMVLEDIAALYRVFSCDKDAGAAPAILQWTDFLAMGNTVQAKDLQVFASGYWKSVFASGVPRMELPTDHPRPPVKRYTGARIEIPLAPGLEAQLRDWGSVEGINPDVILFGAFTAFLHRLSGQDDIVVGVESEPLYFDSSLKALANTRNMLPVRLNFDPASSFKEHIHAQSDILARSNVYRHLSFAELIQLLKLPRDQSRSPIFTVAFRSWVSGVTPAFEALKAAYLVPPSAGARYDLELIVISGGTGTQVICEYSTELFEADTVFRWMQGMIAWLSSGLEDPHLSCGKLPIVQPDEQELLLSRWNKTEKPFPRQQTVLDQIVKQAQNRGEQTAVRFANTSLSYRQLLERVENIATALHTQGVNRGDRVGILLKRSLDLIPAMLATWRVGAKYVPMDIGFPQQRLSYILANANVQTVITNRDLFGLIEAAPDVKRLCVEDVGPQASHLLLRISPARGSDSAIIFFTSGSTGKPKGVEIRQSALLNCLLATQDYLKFAPESSMLALTTISFDVSTNELFMPLIAGGCVDLGEDGLVADGFQLVDRIKLRKPSHIQATASVLRTILIAGWPGDGNICLISMGEALNRDLAEKLLGRCRILWNMYGPTETTVFSSAYQVESAPGKPMRIGRPFPNTQMYILDRRLQPLAIGAIGELYIAGEGLAVGYWQKPELTGQRFIPNPFRPGERMYATGDLARYLPDGNIICLGRLDDQVKIHGVRVELGEVETVLRSVEGVSDAIVCSWRDSRGDTQLVGHVIPTGEKVLMASELRDQLRAHLPEVMIPPIILFSTAFPLTANGKVHRASLPSPNEVGQETVKAMEAPSTPTEKKLATVWAKILGIEVGIIGRDSDFIALGGHSLLMTPLMLEVRQLFQTSFNLRDFFAASTIRKFAARIEASHRGNGKSKSPSRASTSRSPQWARERMDFLQREAQLPLYIAPSRGLSFQPHP
jgi:myxalamid-type nonribosomal peptide synthetase MxaA